MNIQDRLAEIFLPLFDALMNLLTLSLWSRIQGNRIPNIKIKK
jgi:hypothetical protein